MNPIEQAYRAFVRKRFPLPSERQVAALEERIGIQLPPDYREFVLAYNGGYLTEPQIDPPTDACPMDRLTVLYGIGASHPSAELASAADLALFDDNDPPQILPIGYTLMGNLIFVVTADDGDDRGWIGMKIASSDKSFNMGEGIEEFFFRLRKTSDE